jgi:ABC-type antimicrobial peptide transport system permease subunit
VFSAAAKLAIAGCVLGLLGAAAASQVLHSFLFDVSPFDPVVLLLAALFILMLSLLAAYLPARRAASVDPMQALRMD